MFVKDILSEHEFPVEETIFFQIFNSAKCHSNEVS